MSYILNLLGSVLDCMKVWRIILIIVKMKDWFLKKKKFGRKGIYQLLVNCLRMLFRAYSFIMKRITRNLNIFGK